MRNLFLAILAVSWLGGCACRSPIHPTPTGLDAQMRWNEPATNQGCTPRWPLPPAVHCSQWDSSKFYDGGQNLTVTVVRENDLLFIEFLRNSEGFYQVCYWDTSDN